MCFQAEVRNPDKSRGQGRSEDRNQNQVVEQEVRGGTGQELAEAVPEAGGDPRWTPHSGAHCDTQPANGMERQQPVQLKGQPGAHVGSSSGGPWSTDMLQTVAAVCTLQAAPWGSI